MLPDPRVPKGWSECPAFPASKASLDCRAVTDCPVCRATRATPDIRARLGGMDFPEFPAKRVNPDCPVCLGLQVYFKKYLKITKLPKF